MRRPKSILALAALVLVAATFAAAAQSEFPFDRDLVFDARPMRGGKRVPILAFTEDGRVQIDLWCKRGEGQAAIAGDALTITLGPMVNEPCTPERAQADEEMLAALAQVTGWSLRGDVLTLGGARPLRFRLASN